jgi:maleylpyruvate isomerase
MDSPYVARIAEATARLLTTVAKLDDDDLRAPSLLPGWSRAYVVKHLSDNADGTYRLVEAATRGEVGQKYPGGWERREADIASAAAMSAAALRQGLESSCQRLADVLERAGEEVWAAPGTAPDGPVQVGSSVIARLREVEVHHVDLDAGYRPTQWPLSWVLDEIERATLGLPARLPEGTAVLMEATDAGERWVAGRGSGVEVTGKAAEILAWITGRATSVGGALAPELGPWG